MLTTKPNSTSPELIAPCGIDCRLCRAFTREKKACPGCRGDDALKMKSSVICSIKNCEKRLAGKLEYCFDCDTFSCARLMYLDKRYRTRSGASVIDNLHIIQIIGIQRFVEAEKQEWICPECGEMLCMHKPQCLSCGYTWHNQYRS